MKHAAEKPRSPRPRRQWIWMVAFAAAAVLFGAVLLLPRKQPTQPPTETAGDYRPPRTMLLFVHDGGGKLTAAVVLRIDGGVTVTGYPKQTEIVYDTALRPLSACYEREGADASHYMTDILGGSCDAVLRLSVESIASLADRLGNGVVLDDELVTGYRMLELLRDEGETITSQAQVTARCVAAMIDRYLTPKQNMEGAFHLLSALCDDRVIAAQFLSVKDELLSLAKANDGRLCTVVTPSGEVVGVGEERRFVPQNGVG